MGTLKIAKLRYRHYYYFCILGDVALIFNPTNFGSNCKTMCGYMDKTVKKLLIVGQKLASSLRMDLDGPFPECELNAMHHGSCIQP